MGRNATNAQIVLGATAILQILAVVFNLIPVPPVDGFQAISPWLDRDFRIKLSTPPWSTGLIIGFFIIILRLPILPFMFHTRRRARSLNFWVLDPMGSIFFARRLIVCCSNGCA